MKTKLTSILAVSWVISGFSMAQAGGDEGSDTAAKATATAENQPGAADPYLKQGVGDAAADSTDAPSMPDSNQVGILVEFIQLGDREANKLLRKHAASLSAAGLRGELEAKIDAGDARLVECTYVKTKSGQRAKVESIDELIYPTEYDPPEIPQTVTLTEASAPGTAANPTAFETRNLGATLEVDPVIGADRKVIDLNIAPEIVRFLGRQYNIEERHGLEADDPKVLSSTIYQPRFYAIKNNTAVSVRDGDTVLLSINRPDDAPDEMMMVFVRADIVK